MQHYESLDARAGVLLGFSGAIVALAPAGWPPLVIIGTVAAMAAACLALLAFLVPRFELFILDGLWDRYIGTSEVDEERARYDLLANEASMASDVDPLLVRKALLVKWAVGLLAAAVALLGAGVLVDPIGEVVDWFS